jgi:hypothetical protein
VSKENGRDGEVIVWEQPQVAKAAKKGEESFSVQEVVEGGAARRLLPCGSPQQRGWGILQAGTVPSVPCADYWL